LLSGAGFGGWRRQPRRSPRAAKVEARTAVETWKVVAVKHGGLISYGGSASGIDTFPNTPIIWTLGGAMKSRLLLLAACLLAASSAVGYCLVGEEDGRFSVARRLRFCVGEVGVMAPFGIAGRVLEFDYLYGGLRLGAAAAEGFGGLNSNVSGALGPVRAGVTFLSHYEPEFGTATRLRELTAEVGAGLRPTWPLGALWRGSVRGVIDYYSVGLGLEAGVIVIGPSGTQTATPYAALLVQLPTFASRLAGY
jgi:hypothetical protein